MKNKLIFVFVILVLIAIGYRVMYVSKARDAAKSGKAKGIEVLVTEKQILQSTSGSDGNVSTSRDYVIFTDKGAFLVLSDWNEMKTYGQILPNHRYEFFTIPYLGFEYEGVIVTFSPLTTKF